MVQLALWPDIGCLVGCLQSQSRQWNSIGLICFVVVQLKVFRSAVTGLGFMQPYPCILWLWLLRLRRFVLDLPVLINPFIASRAWKVYIWVYPEQAFRKASGSQPQSLTSGGNVMSSVFHSRTYRTSSC